MIRTIGRGVQRLFRAVRCAWDGVVERRSLYRVTQVEDLPDRLANRTLYVVGEPSYPLHASMACPRRRCPTVLNMNLAPDERPQWSLKADAKGRPTLAPSVWERTSCGCHFFLRDGKVEWCD